MEMKEIHDKARRVLEEGNFNLLGGMQRNDARKELSQKFRLDKNLASGILRDMERMGSIKLKRR